MPWFQIQEIDISWYDVLRSHPSKAVHGAAVSKLQWRYLPSYNEELQPLLQRYVLQVDRQQNSQVGESARQNRYCTFMQVMHHGSYY
jgi:hypothetical protein